MPVTLPSWVEAIHRPIPALKPISTGREMKFERKPRRMAPAARSRAPTMRAIVDAAVAAWAAEGSP